MQCSARGDPAGGDLPARSPLGRFPPGKPASALPSVSRGPASRTVAVDFLAESAARYRDDHAIVAIDVIRATTTLVTAVSLGFRCFPVPSLEHAVPLAAKLDRPLLVG